MHLGRHFLEKMSRARNLYIGSRFQSVKEDIKTHDILNHLGSKIRQTSLRLFKRLRHAVEPSIQWLSTPQLWPSPAPSDCWRYRLAFEMMNMYVQICYEYFKPLNRTMADYLNLDQVRFASDSVMKEVMDLLAKEDVESSDQNHKLADTFMKTSMQAAMPTTAKTVDHPFWKELEAHMVFFKTQFDLLIQQFETAITDPTTKDAFTESDVQRLTIVKSTCDTMYKDVQRMHAIVLLMETEPRMIMPTDTSERLKWTRWKQLLRVSSSSNFSKTA